MNNVKKRVLILALVILSIMIIALIIFRITYRDDESIVKLEEKNVLYNEWEQLRREEYRDGELYSLIDSFIATYIIIEEENMTFCQTYVDPDDETFEHIGSACKSYKYDIKDNMITVNKDGEEVTYTYELSNNDMNLKLRSGDDNNYVIESYERSLGSEG